MESSQTADPIGGAGSAWVEAEVPPAAAALEAAGRSPWLAAVLARRGVETAAQAEDFLAPAVEHLHDPFELDGMEAAVDRLIAARDADQLVVIVGDYDVDGVTAVAQLSAAFQACGIRSETIIPHRMRDGYGLQSSHGEAARRLGADVLVTADCGTRAYAAVSRCLELGLDVVITDHHIPGSPHPPAVVHINPHREDCRYPFADLSGSGLAFKLAMALAKRTGREIDPTLMLRVASLGTIADMVPLRGENRTIAAIGLASLPATRSPGLQALLQVARVAAPVKAGDVGFRLGPRLNAAGRMDSAEHALRLLLTRDEAEARTLADRLDDWNRQRQAAEGRVVEEATAYFEARDELPRVLVRAAESWHRGVVGIAAGRLSRAFHRPAILLTLEDGEATGSGRSVPGIDLHALVERFSERLERFGGHAQAIGLAVREDRLPELDEALQAAAAEWEESLLTPRHTYEARLGAAEITTELLTEISKLEPFGVANRRPVFRLGPLHSVEPPRVFGRDQGHLELVAAELGTGSPAVRAVGWGSAERAELFRGSFEILAKVGWDSYRQGVRLDVVDARPHSPDA